MGNGTQKLILIVDDQEDDQGVLAWMLGRLGVINPIFCLRDGHEALRYLNGEGPYADRDRFPSPAAMFLDLQMPIMNGWQVLDWIHSVGLKHEMRIFVYSQPRNVGEVQNLYTLGADSFLRKPVSEADLANLIKHFPLPWEFKSEAAPLAPLVAG
jgi:CheY-like chemotaxis protein